MKKRKYLNRRSRTYAEIELILDKHAVLTLTDDIKYTTFSSEERLKQLKDIKYRILRNVSQEEEED